MTLADALSIQLYSLREFAGGDLDAQLDALAELGFKRVETVGRHLADAAAVRAALDARGMSAPTGHVNLADLRQRFDWVVDQAATLGIEELYMPAVPPEDRHGRDAEFWRALGAELGGFAGRFGERGLALGYHNHNWELVPFADGTTPLGVLFDAAAGTPLTLEADVAWLVRGDADPLAWMEREKGRLTALHVKDIAPVGANLDEDGWADIGEGTLDWPALYREGVARGARWIVLEHDKPSDPVRFSRTGRAFALANFA
ncbi:MAG: sugar phosphate isomerase/epimerase [Acuticoccus sp.]